VLVNRSDVDDAIRGAVLDHDLRRPLTADECPGQVHVESVAEILERIFEERVAGRAAGIVD
jgi:hypothetical protein